MKKPPQNLIVGAKVTLDFGSKWRGVREELRAAEHAKAQKENAHYYGKTGVVVEYDTAECKVLVRLDSDGTTDWHYRGDAHLTELPKDETAALLAEILAADKEIVKLLRNLDAHFKRN